MQSATSRVPLRRTAAGIATAAVATAVFSVLLTPSCRAPSPDADPAADREDPEPTSREDPASDPFLESPLETVGPAGGSPAGSGTAGSGRIVLPVNQVLEPAGTQVELPGMRPQAIALGPDGRILVTSGKTSELVAIEPATGRILSRTPLPSDRAAPPGPVSSHILEPDEKAQLSYTGLIFSHDGRRIFLSSVNGSIKVFEVGFATSGGPGAGAPGARSAGAQAPAEPDPAADPAAGGPGAGGPGAGGPGAGGLGQGVGGASADLEIRGIASWSLPEATAPRRKEEIPAGLALSSDGTRLYVAFNLSNRLGELDAATGKVLRTFEVGVAPYDVVLAGGKAYVSNWGGRRPGEGDLTGPAGRGTVVRVDPVRHIASEGSVSVIDLERGTAAGEILVGLHSSAMALSPDGRHVLVANAGSDTVSVIDAATDRVVETISLAWRHGDLIGATPNALAFDPSGRRLFVANGTQNAVAVVAFEPGASRAVGLIPVGWFPGALAYDARRSALHVANVKGIGSGKRHGPEEEVRLNTHQYFGSLSLVPVPGEEELRRLTATVLENLRRTLIDAAALPPRPDAPPRPVPRRVGEPSVFKHVVYIIKENRTYDQVLGDMPEGKGAPSLCVFGEEVTPNQHKIAREFVLLDNAYCSGILSADGHQWTGSAFATDYMEKSFAGFPRSYPDGMEDDDVDALAYAPTGFLWDNAIAHSRSLRVYGEFAISECGWTDPDRKGAPAFVDYYRDFLEGTGITRIRSRPAIESLRPYLVESTVGWNMDVPDVLRAARFIDELRAFEREGSFQGQEGFPRLVIICLPNDHTSGTKAGAPTPAAHVADNDLAFGRIVEAISKSRFWKETCIFAIEDDPQDGWDHVSAYRTTAYVVSPWTKRGAVVSTQYNQTGVVRTIELILGLPPMNQFDASATPLFDCFAERPDFTPWEAVPSRVPLDQLNPQPSAISDPVLREHALASAELPLDDVDRCPEDLLNRIIWHAVKGSAAPYPKGPAAPYPEGPAAPHPEGLPR